MKNIEMGGLDDSYLEQAKYKPKNYSRRDVLKAGLALGLAALVPTLLKHPSKETPITNVKIDEKSKESQKSPEQIEQERLRKLALERVDIEIRHIIENNSYKDLTTDIARVNVYDRAFKENGKKYAVNPDFLKGLVFVESKGDPGAYNEGSGATGLCQFTETTAKEFDLANRENPYQSIEAAAKFISYYQKFLGSQDLAVASFHMGYGNMYDIISSFVKPDKIAKFPKEVVLAKKLDYFKLYFGSDRNIKPDAYHILFEKLEDDSANYLFKILASVALINLQKTNPAKLKSLYNKENRLV